MVHAERSLRCYSSPGHPHLTFLPQMEHGDSSSSSSSGMPSAIDDHPHIPFHSPVLAYFPRKSGSDAIPIPPTPVSPSIISSLLTSAGVDAALYPPRSYPELGELILAVQDSLFDTLRRNALLYYLLLDYHLLPATHAGSASSIASLSSLAPRSSIIAQFATNHLLPAFWTDSVERGFWRFDKGLHNEAVPWLNTANSSAYANHILRTLSPLKGKDKSVDKAECLVKYVRIAKPVLPETKADLDVVEAVVVSRAIVEGLQGALELIRERPNSEQNALFASLWQWLFQLEKSSMTAHIRSSLLQSVVALPLTNSEVQTLVAFCLGRNASSSIQSPSSTLLRARQLALDTLLVRLLNAGRVLDALKVNSLAEESQGTATVEEDGGEAGTQRRKKRTEMLRLAKEMLPEVVRSQLEEMRVAEEEKSIDISSRDDEMEEDIVAPKATEFPRPAEPAASFNAGTPSSNAPIRGYMHNRLAESTSSSRVSVAATPPPPQRSTPAHQRVHVPLISQSPLAFAASRGETSFSRASPSGTRFTPTPARAQAPARTSDGAVGESEEGPYARLAAQLASQANGDGQPGAAQGDESALLASLLPQKRNIATRRLDAEASGGEAAHFSGLQGAVDDGGDASFEQQRSRSGFEVPKRRYTKKDQVSSKKSEAPPAPRARNASASPAKDPGSSRSRGGAADSSRRGASGLRKSTTMGSLASAAAPREEDEASPHPPLPTAAASRKTPRSTAGKKSSANAAPPTPAATRRSTRAQSESVPGSFPGAAQDDEEEGEGDAEGGEEPAHQQSNADGSPEMLELPSAGRPTSRASKKASSTTASASASASTPRRNTRAKTPSAAPGGGAGGVPTESTPVRRSARRTNTTATAAAGTRSTRGSSRASSVLSSRFGDGSGDDEDQGEGEGEGEEGDALGRELDFGSGRRAGRRGLRTRTRSMSVLSTSTAADEEDGEGNGSGGEQEDGIEEGEGDGDETARRRAGGAGGGGERAVRRSGRRR